MFQSVDLHKMLGQSLNIHTHAGPIHIKALYSLSSHIATDTGHVHINNCHRDTHVAIHKCGNLTIGAIATHVQKQDFKQVCLIDYLDKCCKLFIVSIGSCTRL